MEIRKSKMGSLKKGAVLASITSLASFSMLTGLTGLAVPSKVFAEEKAPYELKVGDVNLNFGGSIRLRTEYAKGALGVGTDEDANWTTQQTRFNIKAKIPGGIGAFIQIQDVRTWGGGDQSFPPPSSTGSGTDASANALDVHQGYFEIDSLLGSGLKLKAGRQEIVLDDARLIGNIGWIQQAQTFDAARFTYGSELVDVNLIGAQLLVTDTHPVLVPYLGVQPEADGQGRTDLDTDSNLYVLHASFKLDNGVINPFVYVVDDPTRLRPGTDDEGNRNVVHFNRIQTSGLFLKLKYGPVTVGFHGGVQSGDVNDDVKINAFFMAPSIAYDIDKSFNVALWYDIYSGDEDPTDDELNTFNVLYATNHSYFGFMDKFLSTPTNGLADTQIRVTKKFAGKHKVAAHYHIITTDPAADQGGEDAGQELDLTYWYKSTKNLTYQLGTSWYAGTDDETNYGSTGDTRVDSTFGYAQINVGF